MSLVISMIQEQGFTAFGIFAYLRLKQAQGLHQVSQRQIARALKCSRNTVSEAIQKLETAKYVYVNGTVSLHTASLYKTGLGAGPARTQSRTSTPDPGQATLPFMAGLPETQSSTSTPDPDQTTPLNPDDPLKVTPWGFEPQFSDRKSDVLGRTRRRGHIRD